MTPLQRASRGGHMLVSSVQACKQWSHRDVWNVTSISPVSLAGHQPAQSLWWCLIVW